MNTKHCSQCGAEFPNTREFFKWSVSRGATQPCRTCLSKQCREYRTKYHEKVLESRRQYKRAHRKEVDAYNRQWERDHPEKVRIRRKAAYDKDPEKHRAKSRRSYKKYAEKYNERSKQYQKLNRVQLKPIKLRREARKRNLPSDFTASDWNRCLTYWSNSCAICGRPKGLWHTIAADHWIPLALPNCPGTVPWNIVPLCHGIDGCNNSKHSLDPLEWLLNHFGARKAKQIAKRIAEYFEWIKQQGK